MDKNRLSAVGLAAAAASLFLAGCATQGGSDNMSVADAGSVKVKCYGANACKGQAECKTANNACKGQNGCKAQGFVMLPEQACIETLGRA